MKLQEVFTEAQYNECIEKIKRKEYFRIEIKGKKYRFLFSHEFCDNGVWIDNRFIDVDFWFHNGGHSYGMQIDDVDSYAKICYSFNRLVKADELELVDGKHKKVIKLSTIITIKKLLKDKADIFLIRDLLLDTTIVELFQDKIISIIRNGTIDAFCKAICAELRALGYEVV